MGGKNTVRELQERLNVIERQIKKIQADAGKNIKSARKRYRQIQRQIRQCQVACKHGWVEQGFDANCVYYSCIKCGRENKIVRTRTEYKPY